MRKPRLAKAVWVLVVALAVVGYGRFQLQPAPSYEIMESASGVFADMNQRGPLVGRGSDTVIVFSNYACVFCAELWAALKNIHNPRGDGPVFRIRHVVHPNDSVSFRASLGAECAAAQGRFTAFSELLFRHYDRLHTLSETAVAEVVGVPDLQAFERCLGSRKTASLILEDLGAAVELEVTGTPTIVTRQLRITGLPSEEQLLKLASGDRL